MAFDSVGNRNKGPVSTLVAITDPALAVVVVYPLCTVQLEIPYMFDRVYVLDRAAVNTKVFDSILEIFEDADNCDEKYTIV